MIDMDKEYYKSAEEIWKDIYGYEGLYQVSDFGKVKSLDRIRCSGKSYKEKILKPWKSKYNDIDKYRLGISLFKNGIRENFYIHQLVLNSFIGPCPKGMEICHNDGDGENNNLNNLRYDTRKNNHKDKIGHGTHLYGSKVPTSKLNELQVRIIKHLLKEGKLTHKEIGEIFGVTRECISRISRNETWKHVII